VFGRHPIINFTTATTVTLYMTNPTITAIILTTTITSITTTDISPIIYYLSLLLRLLLSHYSTAIMYYYTTKKRNYYDNIIVKDTLTHARARVYFGNYMQYIQLRPVTSSWFLFSLKRENSFCRFLYIREKIFHIYIIIYKIIYKII